MTVDPVRHGPVELLYAEYVELRTNAQKHSPSDLSALNSVYTKSILIAAASNLEYRVRTEMEVCFKEISGDETAELIRIKILDRGYHGLFDWKKRDAKYFFTHFGDSAKARFREYCEDSECYGRQAAFIAIGSERNLLVHNDYATISVSKTPDEIIDLYREAEKFLRDLLPLALGGAVDDSA